MPLIVLTADRPPELRDVGAGQTIDQVKLYGGAAKWFLEVDDQPATPERIRWLRGLACRAFWTALEGRPGPVHLNFSLREPLVLDEPLPRRRARRRRARRRAAVGHAARPAGAPAPRCSTALAGELERRPRARDRRRARRARPAARRRARGVRRARRAAAAGRADLGRAPRRRPRSRTTTRCCATPRSARRAGPSWCCGSATCRPPSRCGSGWHGLGEGTLQVAFDPENAWQDPAGAVATLLPADPRAALEALRRAAAARAARGGWLERVDGAATAPPPRAIAGVAGARDRSSASRASPPSWARGCRPRRRSSSPPRCRSATSRRSSPPARTRRACSPTAARTGSTAPSRRRSASPPRGGPVVAADRRRRARARPRRAARRAPARAAARDRAARQRRRRHLRLPPGRRRGRRVRAPRRDARTASTSPTPRRSTGSRTSPSRRAAAAARRARPRARRRARRR